MTDTTTASFATSDVPKEEMTTNLSRWAKRWKESKTGWHLPQEHSFLLKYAPQFIPNYVGSLSTTTEKEGVIGATCSTLNQEPIRVFVPLCGKTVDMRFLAQQEGVSEVVGVDGISKALKEFAQEHPSFHIKESTSTSTSISSNNNDGAAAIATTTATAATTTVERYTGNKITLLKQDLFQLNTKLTDGQFDVILDRASIVAIQPQLRTKYVDIMGQLMKPGGMILLITIDRREGEQSMIEAGPPFSVNEEEVMRLYANQSWVESVTKVEELDMFLDDEDGDKRKRYEGLTSMFELGFIIKAAK